MPELPKPEGDGPQHVYLPDSFILEVTCSEAEVCFTIEAALERDHPLYYSPPKSGEMHAYATLRWCLRGEVRWLEGPHPPRASDSSGQLDYGSVDEWRTEGATQFVSGEFGRVMITEASATVNNR